MALVAVCGNFSAASGQGSPFHSLGVSQVKLLPVALFLVSALVFGFMESQVLGRFDENGTYSLTHIALMSLCAFWWLKLDALQLHRRPSRTLNISVIVLPIAALPYWFFATRKMKDAAVISLGFLVVLALFVALAFVGLSLGS